MIFGDIDPYYRQRQLEKFGQVGQMFVGLAQERRQREEQRRQAELARVLRMIDQYPEVVDRPEGEDLATRFPEIAPILGVVKNRNRTAQNMEKAGQGWLTRAEQIDQQRAAMAAAPQNPLAGISPLAAAPGLAANPPAPAQTGQPSADLALVEAARTMSPAERVQAETWAKARGLQFPKLHQPEVFDPWQDLPQKNRAVLAGELGQLPPDTVRSARVGANIEEGAREKVRRDLDAARGERADRAAAISSRGLDLRDRSLDLQESQAARGGTEPGLTPYQERRVRATRVKELKTRLQDTTKQIEESSAKSTPGKSGKSDPAVPRLFPVHANEVSEWINRNAEELSKASAEGGGTPRGVDELVAALESSFVQEYEKLTRLGVSRREALDMIFSGETATEGESVPLSEAPPR